MAEIRHLENRHNDTPLIIFLFNNDNNNNNNVILSAEDGPQGRSQDF